MIHGDWNSVLGTIDPPQLTRSQSERYSRRFDSLKPGNENEKFHRRLLENRAT